MTATTDFAAGPKVFCENNIVLTPNEIDHNGGLVWIGLDRLDRIAQTGKLVQGRKGNDAVDVYQIVGRPDSTDAIRAYWCPYNRNGTGSVIVGSQAQYMFTITVNGCSVGVGHQATNGTRLVMHVNDANSGSKGPGIQAQSQRITLRSAGTFGTQIVEPSMYRDDDGHGGLSGSATVFGVYEAGQWKIWALKWTCPPSAAARIYEHKGLVPQFNAVS
jgi:hypothetical protein